MKQAGDSDPLRRLQELLGGADIDCAAVGPTTTMRYLLGHAPHADERLCLLLVSPTQAQLVVPQLSAEDLAAHTGLQMLTWTDDQGPAKALGGSLLRGRRAGSLAVDGSMRADFLLPLLGMLAPRRVLSLDPLLEPLRILKTAEEIDALARAAAQADMAMQAATEACRPGATEAEVAWAAEASFRSGGAERVEFTLVAAGANAALPHHASGDKALARGEGVILDIGASLGGFKSDITRVVTLGEPPPELLRVYEIVRRANETAAGVIRPGVSAGEVDAAARKVIEEAGYGEYFIHRTGHGIGLDIHEPPWIRAGEQTRLETGMVFSVEPGVYLPGRLGVRLEDIVVVEADGVQVLTGTGHELIAR
jgi:Xaa-Pro aminopeptidase